MCVCVSYAVKVESKVKSVCMCTKHNTTLYAMEEIKVTLGFLYMGLYTNNMV